MNNLKNINYQMSLFDYNQLKRLEKDNRKNLKNKEKVYEDFEKTIVDSSKKTIYMTWQLRLVFYIYLIFGLINTLLF